MTRGRRIVTWIARALLALLFIAGGTLKLAADPGAVAAFDRLGLGAAGRILIGLCELLGGIGLLLTPVSALAALCLAAVMVGAVFSHLLVLGPSAVPALIVLGLCLFIAWSERANLRTLAQLRSGKGPMDGWVAGAYDRGVQAAFRELLPTLSAELLPQIAGARRALDVGCGPGQVTAFVAEQLPQTDVSGIDLAPTMIELARAHAAASPAAARLRFEIADVARLPFPDGTFDVVLSTGSIKHWPDPVAGLREIHRVLAPGGRAFVSEMNRLAPPEAVATQRARIRHWFFRFIYPHVFAKALTPEEARAIFTASPFGPPVSERRLLDGCLWLFEARRA